MFPTRPEHKSGCTSPSSPRVAGSTGSGLVIMQCRGCSTRWAVPPQAVPQAKAAPPSGYVCRAHHDQAVTWRGTGCARCAADLKRRKAPQPRDDYETETFR
jgi:hypothetical protein